METVQTRYGTWGHIFRSMKCALKQKKWILHYLLLIFFCFFGSDGFSFGFCGNLLKRT